MEQEIKDFKNSQNNELLTLFSNDNVNKNNKFKLEFNTYYESAIDDINIIVNNENYPVIIVDFNIFLEDNRVEKFSVRYPLTESAKFKKLHDLISLINALNIDKYSLSISSANDKELLYNIVSNIKNKKGTKVRLMKKGKPSYYNFEVYPYEQ